jgi:hypothetical protein
MAAVWLTLWLIWLLFTLAAYFHLIDLTWYFALALAIIPAATQIYTGIEVIRNRKRGGRTN